MPYSGAELDCGASSDYDAIELSGGSAMGSITIRNLDDALKRRLRVRAAEHGRSMEEEVREILRQAVGRTAPTRDLGRAIHARFAAIGGVEPELPARGPMREPPTFE
jgi:plasmid stability protein